MGYDDQEIAQHLVARTVDGAAASREMGQWCVEQLLAEEMHMVQERIECPLALRNSHLRSGC